MKKDKANTMTELLRAALRESESMNQVAKDTGLIRQSLSRFMRGEQSLVLDKAERLAEYFGIECKRKGR